MDLKLMIDGYKYVVNKEVLENYHYANITKLNKQYYDEIKIGNPKRFVEDLVVISNAYQKRL